MKRGLALILSRFAHQTAYLDSGDRGVIAHEIPSQVPRVFLTDRSITSYCYCR